MTEGTTYYHFVVNDENKTFHIEETKIKPQKRGLAESSLKSIEKIVSENFKYSALKIDQYSNMNDDLLYSNLLSKADEIKNNFDNRISRKKIKVSYKTKQKNLSELNTKVQNTITTHLSNLIPKVLETLPSNLLDILKIIIRNLNHDTDSVSLNRAKTYGFTGNDTTEAKQFILNFETRFIKMVNDSVIPSELLVFSKNNLDIPKTIEKLKHLDIQDVMKILSQEATHDPNCADIVNFILHTHHPQKIAPHTQKDGQRALTLAQQNNNYDLAKYLLECNVSADFLDDNSLSPLQQALTSLNIPFIELFIEAKAGLDTQDNNGNTPLHYICSGEYAEMAPFAQDILEWLLNEGANPNLKNSSGETPLHLAVKSEYHDFIELLINKGNVDIDEADNDGKTALTYADRLGNVRIRRTLNEIANPTADAWMDEILDFDSNSRSEFYD